MWLCHSDKCSIIRQLNRLCKLEMHFQQGPLLKRCSRLSESSWDAGDNAMQRPAQWWITSCPQDCEGQHLNDLKFNQFNPEWGQTNSWCQGQAFQVAAVCLNLLQCAVKWHAEGPTVPAQHWVASLNASGWLTVPWSISTREAPKHSVQGRCLVGRHSPSLH